MESLDWLLAPSTDLTAAPDTLLRRRAQFALFSLAGTPRDLDEEGMLPTLADLKGSGRIALLPDTVRRALPEFQRDIDALAGSYLDLFNFQESQLDPLLLSEFVLLPAPGGDGPTFRLGDMGARDRRALASQRVRNTLVLKRSLLLNHDRIRLRLLATIQAVRDRVEIAGV